MQRLSVSANHQSNDSQVNPSTSQQLKEGISHGLKQQNPPTRSSYLCISSDCLAVWHASLTCTQSFPPRTQRTKHSVDCWTENGSWSICQKLKSTINRWSDEWPKTEWILTYFITIQLLNIIVIAFISSTIHIQGFEDSKGLSLTGDPTEHFNIIICAWGHKIIFCHRAPNF